MCAFVCMHDVCIVRFCVFIHVGMRMYVFMPILCCVFKQCILDVSDVCSCILEV